jgi:hypothetical protein
MRKAHYVWLIRGREKTLAYYYENPDTGEWGYGFNIADGGGFMPEQDLTDDTKVLPAVIGIAV